MKHWPTTQDTLLVNLANRDQHLVWVEFSSIYEPVIYRFGRRRGLQHADATELTQRVLVKVMQEAKTWSENEPPDRFRSWLKTVAHNLLINMVTREAKHRGIGEESGLESPQEWVNPSTDWESERHRSVLRLAARRIRSEFSSESWQAFELTVFEGVSVTEAAAKLNKSKGSLYAARARIVRRLKQESVRILAALEEA